MNLSNFVQKASVTLFSTVGLAVASTVNLPVKAIVVAGLNPMNPQNGDWNNPLYITGGGDFTGVAQLSLGGFLCTGSLISNHYILTAAHCITTDTSGNVTGNVTVNSGSANFRLGGGADLTNDISININRFIKHPAWNGNFGAGNDIALLRLVNKAPENIERYGIYRDTNEVDQVFTKIGFGGTGTGLTGDPLPPNQILDGKKRIGENRYDLLTDSSILLFDFDNGKPANNAIAGSDLGLGPNEILSGGGDSGGPNFISGLIAGVTSFTQGNTGIPPDINAIQRTFGEQGGDTRVSLFQGFIDSHTALPIPISFSVDGGAFNPLRDGITAPLPNPAEGLFPSSDPPRDPNDVWALSPFLGGYATEGEIFQSSGKDKLPEPDQQKFGDPPDGTNVDRMSSALGVGPGPFGGLPYVGPFEPNPDAPLPVPPPPGGPFGTFGLQPNDNIISLSYGMDSGSILQFSVDPFAIGVPGTDVYFESTLSPSPDGDPGHEAAGDIFKSRQFSPFGSYIPDHLAYNHVLVPSVLLNELYRDESELGLQAPADADEVVPPEDDLDAFEEEDSGDPFWGVDVNVDGIVDPNKFAFFNLDEISPSILNGPISLGSSLGSDDILVTTDPGFSFDIYADGSSLGLWAGDILDALALSDIGGIGSGPSRNAPNGILDRGFDEALFSLKKGSPTLTALGLSPGDVFYTTFTGFSTLYARHDQLGLQFNDELDALDIKPTTVPEPSSIFGLLAIGGLGLIGLRKKR